MSHRQVSAAVLEPVGAHPVLQTPPHTSPHVTIDQPQQPSSSSGGGGGGGNTTPRGKHKYLRMGRWKLYKILAVLAFVVAFLALVFVAILWRREANANHEFRAEMNQQMLKLRDAVPPPAGVAATTTNNRSAREQEEDGGSIPFTLEVNVGKYTRWPAMGGIEGLNFGALSETRLCCEDRHGKYFICDVGTSATLLDVSLSSVVEYDRTTGDSYLQVLVNHESMQGASCRFSWKNKNRHGHRGRHRRHNKH